MSTLFNLFMLIYLNVILLPFILVRVLFLHLTLLTAKYLSNFAYIPYLLLFLIDIFMLVVSFGYINDIAYDFAAMQNMINMHT
jgi:hypothetical protein